MGCYASHDSTGTHLSPYFVIKMGHDRGTTHHHGYGRHAVRWGLVSRIKCSETHTSGWQWRRVPCSSQHGSLDPDAIIEGHTSSRVWHSLELFSIVGDYIDRYAGSIRGT